MSGNTVFVTVYEHKDGMDVNVFATTELANAYADGIGRTYWAQEFPMDPMPEKDIGQAYFDLMAEYGGQEFLSIFEKPILDAHVEPPRAQEAA